VSHAAGGTDIVQRLRDSVRACRALDRSALLAEAADEIKRLRLSDEEREAMGVKRDLSWDELKEGFPPAYTEHIGRQAAAHIEAYAP